MTNIKFNISLAALTLCATIAAAGFISPLSGPQAQSSSSSATEEEADEQVTENIKKLILEQVSQNQVRGVTDAQAASHRRATIGEISRVTDAAITIKYQDRQQIIPLEGALLLKGSNLIDVEDVAVGNWATVMGNIQDEEIDPDFILVTTTSLQPDPKLVFVGTITDITRSSITILPRSEDGERELDITTATNLEDPDGRPALFTDFSEDMTVMVTAAETEEGIEVITIHSLAPLNAVAENQ